MFVARVTLLLLCIFACEPVGDGGSTGGEHDGTTSDGNTGSFLVAPDVGIGGETEGGEVNGRWYSPCLTAASDFVTCEAWCRDTGFGECLAIKIYADNCGGLDEGDNVVGECHSNPFTDWPETEGMRLRCACVLP